MYKRTLFNTIKMVNDMFPVLLLTGPRQVGKTTLLDMCKEKERQYITLDDLEIRSLANEDPALFFKRYTPPLIIDEVQYAPNLLSYIKLIVDKDKKNGLFWLTGSQKFHLMKGISESLAGRVAILDLLGFSQSEISGDKASPFLPTESWIENSRVQKQKPIPLLELYEKILRGSFPKLYDNKNMDRDLYYKSYIQTYIQRDVKDVLNITDEMSFYKFLSACAARSGQLINYSDMARDVGVTVNTIKSWISILETSGILYLLKPYSTNVTKRLVKTPKLYFLDTGLCSYLTKWPDARTLESGAMAGSILETYMMSEILKSYWHHGKEARFFYYRDLDQKEVDLIIEEGDTLYPVEFKKTSSPKRTASKHFKTLDRLGKNIGHGGILCLCESDIPLSESVTSIPLHYL